VSPRRKSTFQNPKPKTLSQGVKYFLPLTLKSKKGQDGAGGHGFRGGGAPKCPYMCPQARRQDLSN